VIIELKPPSGNAIANPEKNGRVDQDHEERTYCEDSDSIAVVGLNNRHNGPGWPSARELLSFCRKSHR
jgi:hypothetical protein